MGEEGARATWAIGFSPSLSRRLVFLVPTSLAGAQNVDVSGNVYYRYICFLFVCFHRLTPDGRSDVAVKPSGRVSLTACWSLSSGYSANSKRRR